MVPVTKCLRQLLLSRHATGVAIVAVLVIAFVNEWARDAVLLREGGVPPYLSVRMKPTSMLVLRGGGRTRYHVGFEDGFFGFGTELGRIDFADDFTIELVGTPLERQPAYAHLISNHPGSHDYEGLAIRQDGDIAGSFCVLFGIGSGWRQSRPVYLAPKRRFYLAVIVEHSRLSVFKDGVHMYSMDMGDVPRYSDLPLTVGNWHLMDHKFNGSIEEVRVTVGALPTADIELNARHLGLLGSAGPGM
jgi:hypothetical protein